MKELVLKRQCELEEICREVHMDVNIHAARQSLLNLIDSGDLSDILESLDAQIQKEKEEALSRKEISDKVDKLKHAKEEEKWLDDYEQDGNRFSAVRGAHNGHRSRTGGLSVSLSALDGNVLGGCVAGLLIAASPVQDKVAAYKKQKRSI